jgi:hypothetical protein
MLGGFKPHFPQQNGISWGLMTEFHSGVDILMMYGIVKTSAYFLQ